MQDITEKMAAEVKERLDELEAPVRHTPKRGRSARKPLSAKDEVTESIKTPDTLAEAVLPENKPGMNLVGKLYGRGLSDEELTALAEENPTGLDEPLETEVQLAKIVVGRGLSVGQNDAALRGLLAVARLHEIQARLRAGSDNKQVQWEMQSALAELGIGRVKDDESDY